MRSRRDRRTAHSEFSDANHARAIPAAKVGFAIELGPMRKTRHAWWRSKSPRGATSAMTTFLMKEAPAGKTGASASFGGRGHDDVASGGGCVGDDFQASGCEGLQSATQISALGDCVT